MSKEKLLFKNLDRFDMYIASVDRKAAFLVTFNTFVMGTLLLKYTDILKLYKISQIQCSITVLLVICLISVIIAIILAFWASKPYLGSGNQAGGYTSLLFFGSVAEMDESSYSTNISSLGKRKLKDDLIHQTHTLALALDCKFKKIKISKFFTIAGVLFPIGIATTLLIIDYMVRGN
jgi:hypothetical protein